jgi:uncharacterized membrane protein YgdD (TMEM256/DUF423 family)
MVETTAPCPATARRIVAIAGILGATGVILGAYGAHGLEDVLQKNPAANAEWLVKRLDQFDVGVRYHLIHAVAMLALAALAPPLSSRALRWITGCWLVGVLIFSGMLYLLVLTNTPVLGAIVPIGGVFLIVGWIAVVVSAWRSSTDLSQ